MVRRTGRDGPIVRLELPAGPGVAVFDGTLADDRLDGSFIQGPAKGTFTLQRGDAAPPKPADPAETLPCPTEDVTFGHGDAVVLEGD